MDIHLLSVILPTYNEASTITQILQRVIESPLPAGIRKEIIVVDDASTDDTSGRVKEIRQHHSDVSLIYVRLSENQGKGHAVRTGLTQATGQAILIQDADLEYDPRDYAALLQPLLDDTARVVYGSRILKRDNPRGSFAFYGGGRLLSGFTTLLFGQRITDESTCYKLFSTDVLRSLPLTSNRFGFCPEVTGRLLRQGIHIHEVPISYHPRTRGEGKKIHLRDGIEALYLLMYHRYRPLSDALPGQSKQPSGATRSGRLTPRFSMQKVVTNAFALAVSVLLIVLLFARCPQYRWVYHDLLQENMTLIRQYPHLSFDQKMEMKLGVDYSFLMYIRSVTPPDAVILYPTPEAFRREGSPFTHGIDNKICASRFLYPRKLVLESEWEQNRYTCHITHAVIVNGVMPTKFTLDVDSVPQHVVLEIHSPAK